jgi:hypothetical protein
MGTLPELGVWAAGSGAIEGLIVRGARGALVYAGLILILRGIRPSHTRRAPREREANS